MNAIANRRTTHWRAVTRVSTVIAVSLAVLAAPAFAQAPAWPTDGQQQAAPSGPAWPADGGGQQARPTGVAPAPMMGAPGGFGPPQGGRPPGMAPGGPGGMGMGPPPNEQQQKCVGEFNRLRGEVDRKGQVAKGVSDRKGSREELCSAVTGIFGAESKWFTYAKDNATVCGIPPDVIKQLAGGHENLSKVKTQVCSGAPTAGAAQAPRAPSLSEALGTTNLPTQQNTTVKRGGTLDTLTGNPIR